MWIAILGVALLAVLMAAVALVLLQRRARETQQRELRLQERITVLEKELSAMMDGAFGVASQLRKVENNLKSTVQQQEQLQQRDMGNLPYNEAVRRVSKGADVDELVEHCGLSRSEAELVEMLHKKSQPPVVAESVDSSARASSEAVNSSVDTAASSVFETPQQSPVEALEVPSQKPADDELDMDNGPLFSGELGGEDFQQALERAREYQSSPNQEQVNDPANDDEQSDKH